MRRLLLLPWLLYFGGLAAARATVYECRATSGQMTYQDMPCGKAQDQRVLALPELPRSPPITAPTAHRPVLSPAEPAPRRPPAPPVAATRRMYGCVRATDGKPYVSQRGDPEPYLAPFGMLGAGQLPLAQAYAPTQGAAGISAPEANRGRLTAGLVADNYVWVQDQCRQLTPQEACTALRDDFERNAHALDKAFKSDRPPLEKRDRDLRVQLRGC